MGDCLSRFGPSAEGEGGGGGGGGEGSAGERGGSGEAPPPGRDETDVRIAAFFETYRDPHEDAMLSDGIERLCEDLRLSPDSFPVLALAWKLSAERMCRFTRDEFVGGMKRLRCDSAAAVTARLPEVVAELAADADTFKDLYRFTFAFGLDAAAGRRTLPVDVAVALWRLVFSGREPPLLADWLDYLERNPRTDGIPKDTWYMFLNFCEAVGDDLGGYDDTEAWPSLFDDFVEYRNDQTNQNVTEKKTE